MQEQDKLSRREPARTILFRNKTPAGAVGSPTAMTISKFNVEGNTILAQDKIDAILDKYKGAAFQFKDADQARLELEKAYHAAGYPTVLVNLPEQTIEQGIVTLQVIEASLLEIKVTGQQYYSKYRILEKLPSIKMGTVLYEPKFVKELAAINVNPDLQVAPVLKPGTEPGTVDLELKVRDRLPVHGKLEADNRGPITTPQNRLVAEIQHTNLFGGDEVLTVNTVQTPTDWGAVPELRSEFRLSGEMARSSAGRLRVQIAKHIGFSRVGHFSRRWKQCRGCR